MRSHLRAILGMLVGLAMAVTLLAPTPAQAAPSSPPVHSQISVPTAFTLSSTQWSKANYAAKARNKAISSSGKAMDYRKMKTVYGKHYIWRRTMAAGFRQAGGKISHISKAEAKKVEKQRKVVYGKRKPLKASASTMGTISAKDSPCKGKSGKVVVSRNETHKYWNSCQTIDLQYYWGGCVAGMGFIAKFVSKDPRIDIPAYFIAAGCGLVAGDISRQAAKSDIGAIYLKTYKQETYMPYSGGTRYYVEYHLLPQ